MIFLYRTNRESVRLRSGLSRCFSNHLTLTTSDERASKMGRRKQPRISPTHKVCSTCKVDKLASEFSPFPRSPDGLRYLCRECVRAYKRGEYVPHPIEREVQSSHKHCAKCGETKPRAAFSPNRLRRDGLGLSSYCKSCINAKTRENYRLDPAKHIARSDVWRRANQPRVTRRRVGERVRLLYGLTPEAFAQLRAAQNDRCGICNGPFEKWPNVDHDHVTGAMRALLCRNCNLGLGHFKDRPDLLELAAAYLETHVAKRESA